MAENEIPVCCKSCLVRQFNECSRDPVEQALCLRNLKEAKKETVKYKKYDAG